MWFILLVTHLHTSPQHPHLCAKHTNKHTSMTCDKHTYTRTTTTSTQEGWESYQQSTNRISISFSNLHAGIGICDEIAYLEAKVWESKVVPGKYSRKQLCLLVSWPHPVLNECGTPTHQSSLSCHAFLRNRHLIHRKSRVSHHPSSLCMLRYARCRLRLYQPLVFSYIFLTFLLSTFSFTHIHAYACYTHTHSFSLTSTTTLSLSHQTLFATSAFFLHANDYALTTHSLLISFHRK